MIVLVLLIQIASLLFYFRIVAESYTYNESTWKRWFWYFITGLNFLFICRFIFVQINFSYRWYDQITEFLSLGISLFIVIPISIYYLIKRNRRQKKK